MVTKLKAVSTWRNAAYEGKERVLYDGKFHSKEIAKGEEGKPIYLSWDKDQSSFLEITKDPATIRMALPSVTHGKPEPTGTLRLELLVAEVGKNKLLEAIHEIFAKGKDPAKKLLKEASGKLLDPPSEEATAAQ